MYSNIKVGDYIYVTANDKKSQSGRERVTRVTKTQFSARGYNFSKRTGKAIGKPYFASKTQLKTKAVKKSDKQLYCIVGERIGMLCKDAYGNPFEFVGLKSATQQAEYFGNLHNDTFKPVKI